MDGKPAAFDRDESHDREGRPDDALSAWSTSSEIGASHERADGDAGRVYPHAVVGEWLKTWGKPGRKPSRDWLADTRG